MADEQDIGGWVETPEGVEWDIDGVVERDVGEEADTTIESDLILTGNLNRKARFYRRVGTI